MNGSKAGNGNGSITVNRGEERSGKERRGEVGDPGAVKAETTNISIGNHTLTISAGF